MTRAPRNRLEPKRVQSIRKKTEKNSKKKGKGPFPRRSPRDTSAECVSLTGKGSRPWEIRQLPVKRSKAKGLNLLTSKAWLKSERFAQTSSYLPLIDKLGRYTGTVLYRTSMTPQGFISTVVSTILRRLKFLIINRGNTIFEYRKRQNVLLRCASYYALSKNSYFWDRILALTKDLGANWRTISSLVHRFSSKLDDHKWFVHGHVCLQTQWLTSRALRPRDKSTLNGRAFMYTTPRRGARENSSDFNHLWHTFWGMSQMAGNLV